MNDDEVFKLNSLHRFQKHSKLVLEAHSHCEVPAGCGGAVLQWVARERGIRVRVHVQTSLRVAKAFIDGAPASGLGVRLTPGSHLLALAFVPDEKPAAVSWAMVHLEQRVPNVARYPEQRVPRSQSQADGTWRAVTSRPADDWATPAFDDSRWKPLARSSFSGTGLAEWPLRQFRQELDLGTVPLALDAPTVWLRKRFDFTEVP